MSTASVLKAVRLTHHYIGIFIAPAVLFFSFTGFLQMFSFHEATHNPGYVPPALFVHLAQLHKKATLDVPAPKPAPKPAAKTAPKPEPGTPTPTPPPPRPPEWKAHLPMKLFFGLVAVGLFTSTLTGLYMAWKYNRSKPLAAGVFLAGIAIPALLLLI
jgi:hypothetical protein